METILDAHQHFWRFEPGQYPWISQEMHALRRDFLPQDLKAAARSTQVVASVAIQARQSLAETRWLLDLARTDQFICGVVGWLPLDHPDTARQLEDLAREPKLCGVRHVLQDETDPDFMLRRDFNCGIAQLTRHDLTYDILIFEHQLLQALRFVDLHPEQRFVLDHLAKPRIREGLLAPWREHLRELARRPNVWCKLSGLVTEADTARWREPELRPYIETALESFGPARLMFGSDWPVCLLACDYSRWLQVVLRSLSALSFGERTQVLKLNALSAYHIER